MMATKVTLGLFYLVVLSSPLTGEECPKSFVNIADKGCFHFNNTDTSSWQGSRAYCQGLGGDLAVFDDCSTFKWVVRYISMKGNETQVEDGHYYWAGASDLGEEGSWYWINFVQVELGPPLWGFKGNKSEPNGSLEENCAALNKDVGYYIFDESCDEEKKYHSLCQAQYLPEQD